jgi:UDP-glucose 4-epimerase
VSSTSGGRVLVTGGAGFVGATMVRVLLERGYSVTVVDDLSSGRVEHIEGLPLDFVERDVTDQRVGAHVAGHDAVVHLAAQSGVPPSLKDPRRDCEVNVLGTLNLLEAARGLGVGRFVFASSNAPLGRQPPPATEATVALPASPYGASKLAGEAYCLAYHGSWGLATVALRFGNVYGPYSSHKQSVVARFLRDVLTSGAITVDGDGLQTRDFIYVGDLCRAAVAALESGAGGEVFQIATGTETSILELATLLQRVTRRAITVHHDDARRGDVRHSYARIAKAKALLGWEPEVGLEDGLGMTWEWTRAAWGAD